MEIHKSEEWAINLGIVGFDRIVQFAQENLNLNLEYYNYNKRNDDFIEFDVHLLDDFGNYYFEYFLDRYNSSKDQIPKLEYYFRLCKKDEKFKESLKYLKDIIKKNNEKIKKINKEIFERCNELYKEISSVKNSKDIGSKEDLIKEYCEILEEDNINRIITMNKFKSILSNNYFGQSSFLNVGCSSNSIEEQKRKIQKDYVMEVIYIEDVKKIVRKSDEEELKQYVLQELKKYEKEGLTSNKYKNGEKFISKINKELFGKKRKAKDVNEILNSYSFCSICENEISFDEDYSEGNFIPLGISAINSKNMFWNLEVKYPIGSLCKLILLCTAAGATDLFKSYLDDKYDYKDKAYYGFVNIEGGISELIKTNNDFQNKTDKDISFGSFILDNIDQTKKISKWKLENILYIEFNTDYGSKKCKLNYFNVPRYIAEFISEHASLIKNIKSHRTRYEAFDLMLAHKNLHKLIERKFRDKYRNPVEIFQLDVVALYLRIYKEGEKMSKDDKYNKQLNSIYVHGIKLSKKIRIMYNQENKIQGITYKLLNAAKANNKANFMDIILRVHMTYEEEVPPLFLDAYKEERLTFDEIVGAFVAGLLVKEDSNKN